MRLAWTTDIHLNFVREESRRREFYGLLGEDADAVVISGDIGESDSVVEYLQEMERTLQRPIYFVLGNHDFYRGSIRETRDRIARISAESEHLLYLTDNGCVELTPTTALVGHDGWGDARLGDFMNSTVMLNDYQLIEELQVRKLGWDGLRARLLELGDEAAKKLEHGLVQATAKYPNVIVATHVPPFREASWYDDRPCDDNWLPHFSCKVVGDAMLRTMKQNPESNLLVLCGHTHGGGEVNLLDNLRVLTGPAYCGSPEIQRVLDVY